MVRLNCLMSSRDPRPPPENQWQHTSEQSLKETRESTPAEGIVRKSFNRIVYVHLDPVLLNVDVLHLLQ